MTDKQQVMKLIEKMPDDATIEDIKYELDVLAMLKTRLDEAENGNTISHEEARRRLKHWLE